MEKIITARHFHIETSTKEHILDRLDAIDSEYKKLTSARVVIDMQRSTYFAEVVLYGKRLQIGAKAQADDLQAAADMALHRADRQLRKHLDKVKDHTTVSLAANEAAIEGVLTVDSDVDVDVDFEEAAS